jgi:hypothetical protein
MRLYISLLELARLFFMANSQLAELGLNGFEVKSWLFCGFVIFFRKRIELEECLTFVGPCFIIGFINSNLIILRLI